MKNLLNKARALTVSSLRLTADVLAGDKVISVNVKSSAKAKK